MANKSLLDAYLAVPRVSQNFCRTANNTDFKVHTRYRMTMAGNMEQVGPDGELKHLTLGEQGYTNQLATYGGIVALNRQQLHNDDLNALVDTSRFLGRKSAIAVEKAVFTLLLSNPASFFSAGNKNLVTGAASALSVSGITAAEQKFMDQVDEQGEPVALIVVPKVLAVEVDCRRSCATKFISPLDAPPPIPAMNFENSNEQVGYLFAWFADRTEVLPLWR